MKSKKILIVVLLIIISFGTLSFVYFFNKKESKINYTYDEIIRESLKYRNDEIISDNNENELNYKKFLKSSSNYSEQSQALWIKKYNIRDYNRYSFNQEDGKLVFFDKDNKPTIVANAQMAGTFAIDRRTNLKTWEWSWGNSSVVYPNSYEKILEVKSFGEKYKENFFIKYGKNILSDESFGVDEDEVNDINMFSSYIIGARGFYWAPVDEYLSVLLLITDIKWADENDSYLVERSQQENSNRALNLYYQMIDEDVEIYIPFDDYTYYITELPHNFKEDYSNLLDFITSKDETILEISKYLSNKYTLFEALEGIFKIVGDNYYLEDIYYGRNEYPKYPLETLVDGTGDCEDTSFLFASLLKSYLDQSNNIFNNKVALLEYPDHIAVGLGWNKENYLDIEKLWEEDGEKLNAYFNEDDDYYYIFIETTSPDFNFGFLPDDLKKETPNIYIIKNR